MRVVGKRTAASGTILQARGRRRAEVGRPTPAVGRWRQTGGQGRRRVLGVGRPTPAVAGMLWVQVVAAEVEAEAAYRAWWER